MNNTNKPANLKDKRRYKYGSLSIGITIAFLALIIAVNLIFSGLSLSGDLTVDLTQEEFATVSDSSVELLSQLGKDLDVTIYFMSERDRFDDNVNKIKGINMMSLCRDLAENYANIFDGSGDKGKITVEYMELNSNPAFEKEYKDKTGMALNPSSIIVQGKTKEQCRILSMGSFYTLDENGVPSAFGGEYRLTNAMLACSRKEPVAVSFTWGHGENIPGGQINASSDAVALAAIFQGAGFDVETVDLHTQEISEKTKVLICLDPTQDFSEEEIVKLNKYTDDNNSFIVFVDSATPNLTNLRSFLSDYWGLDYNPGAAITDNANSKVGVYESIFVKASQIESDKQSSSPAYQINRVVADEDIKTIMPYSVELMLAKNHAQSAFNAEILATSYDTAANSSANGAKGEIPTILISNKHEYGENDVLEFAHVMLVGSTEFAKASCLATEEYANKYVLLAAARQLSAENIASDIKSVPFAPTELDITSGEASTLTWIICTVIPGIIIILGIVMFFRRRHL